MNGLYVRSGGTNASICENAVLVTSFGVKPGVTAVTQVGDFNQPIPYQVARVLSPDNHSVSLSE